MFLLNTTSVKLVQFKNPLLTLVRFFAKVTRVSPVHREKAVVLIVSSVIWNFRTVID